MRRRRSPPATRTTRTTRGSETLAHALSADRQDDKTLFCVSAVSAFSSPPDAVIDRGALRNDYETTSTRRGGVQWPDSDGSFALQVGALDRASVRAHVCALSYAALYVRRPRRVGERCFAFEEAFMKSITIRNLCLLNAPPSSRGLIFPRAAAKKEPRYKKNRYTV